MSNAWRRLWWMRLQGKLTSAEKRAADRKHRAQQRLQRYKATQEERIKRAVIRHYLHRAPYKAPPDRWKLFQVWVDELDNLVTAAVKTPAEPHS